MEVSGLKVDGRAIIAYQEKIIDKFYDSSIYNTDISFGTLHVKMSTHLGEERTSAMSLYGRALRASYQETLDVLKKYCEKQRR